LGERETGVQPFGDDAVVSKLNETRFENSGVTRVVTVWVSDEANRVAKAALTGASETEHTKELKSVLGFWVEGVVAFDVAAQAGIEEDPEGWVVSQERIVVKRQPHRDGW
jgi:hypothetical protein